MKQLGEVISEQGGKAYLVIKRVSACGENCASCKGCQNSTVKITAENPLGAKAGQKVIVESKSSGILFTAFLVYILPILLMFLSYGISSFFTANRTTIKVILLTTFLGSLILLKLLDTYVKRTGKMKAVVTKIIN